MAGNDELQDNEIGRRRFGVLKDKIYSRQVAEDAKFRKVILDFALAFLRRSSHHALRETISN
jgi:hypothetical protein